jgi:16S rRNA (adenine1518-N6/adenine1519-N6)-dimethyltransferase
VVRITKRDASELPARDNDLFGKLVRSGFSQRRKQLQKLLRPHFPQWERVAATLGFDPKARAEELSLLQWIGLTNLAAAPPHFQGNALQQERFPVVDESDRILRYAYRSEVHANNLRHRAVHILIFDAGGKVYLQKRSRDKDRYPLRWDSSTGGHVSAGEGYDEAAERELQEEIGITVPLEKVGKLPASPETDNEFIWLYRGELRGEPHPNPVEIEAGAFFSPAIVDGWTAARADDFTPAFLECWKTYRAGNATKAA